MIKRKSYRPFFYSVLLITLFGFFIFSSASLGLLSRGGARFDEVTIKQLLVLLLGILIFLVISRIDYRYWQKLSPIIFITSVIAMLLVFVPHIGLAAGGARRWIMIGSYSFQPSELLKLGFVLYLAAQLAKSKEKIRLFRYGLLPFLILLAIVGALMIAEPDIDTLVIMFVAGLGMFFIAGAKWRHLFLVGLVVILAIGTATAYKPYIRARINTFFDPTQNTLSSSYQVNQSLIAIGSGGITGRGFGRSIQKFKYLPEPIGDSIFSVASEEFGFVGSVLLVFLFVALGLSGLKISVRAPTPFGRLVTAGIVIMILAEAFINIAAMLGLIPLSGTPLLFVSQGGTALLFTLAAAGIVLNVSLHPAR